MKGEPMNMQTAIRLWLDALAVEINQQNNKKD